MDGRDLAQEIIPNYLQWNPSTTILDIAHAMPAFIIRLKSSKVYSFYGKYHLGALYDLKNFNNMLVISFSCKIDATTFNSPNNKKKVDDDEFNLILSDDSLILFENYENNQNMGKLVFWCTLYSIIETQINKMQKIVIFKIYNDVNNTETLLKLKIDNILFFREALVKRMNGLKVRVEALKVIKGQQIEKRLTDKDINSLGIEHVVQHLRHLQGKIEANDVTYYNVNTFMRLCGRAVEFYSAKNDENHILYLNTMKNVLTREDVQKILYGDK
jgi:hypothetical protein